MVIGFGYTLIRLHCLRKCRQSRVCVCVYMERSRRRQRISDNRLKSWKMLEINCGTCIFIVIYYRQLPSEIIFNHKSVFYRQYVQRQNVYNRSKSRNRVFRQYVTQTSHITSARRFVKYKIKMRSRISNIKIFYNNYTPGYMLS